MSLFFSNDVVALREELSKANKRVKQLEWLCAEKAVYDGKEFDKKVKLNRKVILLREALRLMLQDSDIMAVRKAACAALDATK